MATTNETGDRRDYRATLNITLNDKDPGAFPQRGNLPAKEPLIQQRWEEMDLYALSLSKPAPKGPFVLHDGPPYSNGDIHLGHALNKVAKDIITRFRTMQGFSAPYVPGWDNHGMPIENAVAKAFRAEKRDVDRVTLRQACREYAANWVEIQSGQFKRLGIRGQWDDPYLTMSYDFESTIVRVFGELAEKGYIYRGLKPVFWCATCETALADAEVEYDDHTSNSIYVRFPLLSDPKGLLEGGEQGPYAIIWTTTPWTIPANLALAVHPDADYVLAAIGKERYLVAEPLLESVMNAITSPGAETGDGGEKQPVLAPRVVRRFKGVELEGLVFRHPLFNRASPVLLADYVTMDAGTGIVHTAPGHGKEDFDTGARYGLEVLNPVDGSGRYTAAAGEYDGRSFQGLRVTTFGHSDRESEANVALVEALAKSGNLLSSSKTNHSYPHCWRCHSPLIFRATVQWFMNIDHQVEGSTFRETAIRAINDVTWYPRESINRITTMVAGRPDWCVSRQRSWGVGIPAFYCNGCGEPVLTPQSVTAVADLVLREGSDAWYHRSAEEILPPAFACPHCSAGTENLRKETDVLDVWFDSGSTNRAVLDNKAHWPNLEWPADVYLEGGDQHRGWFNSSLMIATATRGRAPYRSVITNGWTLDENGEAFSKSKGNGVNPLTVIDQYGADIVRWWVVSQNLMEDTRCGDNLLKQVSEMYRRIRNTFRFLVNNLYDFDPNRDTVSAKDMEELDLWALEQLNLVVQTSENAYNRYEFHRVYQSVINFCSVELSAFYLDVLKDRLYASPAESRERRSAQTAMHTIAETLARLLAPILVHTAEEVWDFLKLRDEFPSVHLAALPISHEPDTAVTERWAPLLTARDAVKKAIEEARQAGTIGNPLESHVTLPETYSGLATFGDALASLFLVSQVSFGAVEAIEVAPASGVKCARCWLVKRDVGEVASSPDLCVRCAEAIR